MLNDDQRTRLTSMAYDIIIVLTVEETTYLIEALGGERKENLYCPNCNANGEEFMRYGDSV